MNLIRSIIRDHNIHGVEVESATDVAGLPAPAWVHEGCLYEIFVRAFSDAGTLNEVTAALPRIKDLGVKTIWLMPIHPTGRTARKGVLGSPYSIHDYYSIDPAQGTKADFSNLVERAHDLNLRVIMDFVANHAAIDHVSAGTDSNMFKRNEQGEPMRIMADWSDICDLNYDRRATHEYMKAVANYWIREFDIDGYRCDVAGMVPQQFWEDLVADLLAMKPDLFMLAEWEAARLHKAAFHATYDWTLYALLKDVHAGKRPASQIAEQLQWKSKAYPVNALPLRFTENHDEKRTISQFGQNSFYPFVVLQFLLHGIPLLYAGQESGAEKSPSKFNQPETVKATGRQDIFTMYCELNRLRRLHDAFRGKEIQFTDHDQKDSVLAFTKKSANSMIAAILNFSPKTRAVTLPFLQSWLQQPRLERIFFNLDHITIEKNKLILPAHGVIILERH